MASGPRFGVLLFAWGLGIGVAWPIAIAVGVAVLLFTGLVWRPGGPGQRWRRYMLRRFPRKDDLSS
jgi:hypothetical protein